MNENSNKIVEIQMDLDSLWNQLSKRISENNLDTVHKIVELEIQAELLSNS